MVPALYGSLFGAAYCFLPCDCTISQSSRDCCARQNTNLSEQLENLEPMLTTVTLESSESTATMKHPEAITTKLMPVARDRSDFIDVFVAGHPKAVAIIRYGGVVSTVRHLRRLVKAQLDPALLPPRWGFAFSDGVKVRDLETCSVVLRPISSRVFFATGIL